MKLQVLWNVWWLHFLLQTFLLLLGKKYTIKTILIIITFLICFGNLHILLYLLDLLLSTFLLIQSFVFHTKFHPTPFLWLPIASSLFNLTNSICNLIIPHSSFSNLITSSNSSLKHIGCLIFLSFIWTITILIWSAQIFHPFLISSNFFFTFF